MQQRGPFQQPREKQGSDPQESWSIPSTAEGLDVLPARKRHLGDKEGRAQPATSTAVADALLATFQRKARLLLTGESPKACRDGDVPLQASRQAEGQHRWGLSVILCLAREDLSAPQEAWHRLATGLAVPPRGKAPEPGSSLAWRHPLPLSGDKELKPGRPQQVSGLLRWSRLENRPRAIAGSSGEGSATSQREAGDGRGSRRAPQSSRSAEGVTSCESRPS